MNSVDLDTLNDLRQKCSWIARTAQEDLGRIELRYLSDIYLYFHTQLKVRSDPSYDVNNDDTLPDWLI